MSVIALQGGSFAELPFRAPSEVSPAEVKHFAQSLKPRNVDVVLEEPLAVDFREMFVEITRHVSYHNLVTKWAKWLDISYSKPDVLTNRQRAFLGELRQRAVAEGHLAAEPCGQEVQFEILPGWRIGLIF